MSLGNLDSKLKIEIRPVPNQRGIKEFSDNLEYFSQAHIIHPFVNPNTLKYDVGLTEDDVEELKKQGCPYNLDTTFVNGQPHEFWESSLVKTELKSTPMFLYPGSNIIDYIKYKYLQVNNYIYTSEEEMLSGSKPEATHYIYNEQVENKIKATKIQKRNALVNKLSDVSLSEKKNFILIINNEIAENKSPNDIEVALEDIMQDTDKRKKLEELLSEEAEKVSLFADIKTAIQKGVLRQTKKGIFYFDNNLGFDIEDVYKLLNDKENQEILINIKSKIE